MEIERARRFKTPSKKINGFLFSRNRNKLQCTTIKSRDTPTLIHDHSKIRRAISRRRTDAKISRKEVAGITIVKQHERRYRRCVSLTATGVFDRESELARIDRARTYTGQRIHNQSEARLHELRA